jgi:hypothetical protein
MEVDGGPPSMENKLVASSRACVRACVRAVRMFVDNRACILHDRYSYR